MAANAATLSESEQVPFLGSSFFWLGGGGLGFSAGNKRHSQEMPEMPPAPCGQRAG